MNSICSDTKFVATSQSKGLKKLYFFPIAFDFYLRKYFEACIYLARRVVLAIGILAIHNLKFCMKS